MAEEAGGAGLKPLAIDLFCGLGGWAEGFLAEGYRVIGFDVDRRFSKVYPGEFVLADVRTLDGRRFRDATVIVASPPCEKFSVMTIGKNWNHDRTPKTPGAAAALELALKTFALVDSLKPIGYCIENPRGMLRKLAPRPPDATTWYCRWGMPYAKPTDLWTNLKMAWPTCRNGGPDHPYTPRGTKTHGTQGRSQVTNPRYGSGHVDFSRTIGRGSDAALRAKIPLPLARAVARAFLPAVIV